jgi:glucosyl-3-phosphoglycerate synthase
MLGRSIRPGAPAVPGSGGPRSYRWQDWELRDLVAAKDAAGRTVSLVVPARNEAAGVGSVVRRVRTALMETVALLDEIVVIDSDSEDDTFAVAADTGAAVYRSREIRPDLGSHPGKGEALWKSLFVTRGDLLVFMDADLIDWDTHFVPGLLGPLLTEPEITLVKGRYERPYLDGGTGSAQQGGRVTELVALPLITLLFPQLRGLAQPLAGEWAIRRSQFESVSVPTGYGVEIAALIDTLHHAGPSAIAQVDLGRRTHRHQSLHDLGAMATQVMAAALSRATGELPPGMTAPQVIPPELIPAELIPPELIPPEMVLPETVPLKQVPVRLTERPPARLVA